MSAEPRVYPVEQPAPGDTDPRFTFGLTIDVAKVLVEHGYPETTSGADIIELQQALYRFIYRSARCEHGIDTVECRPCRNAANAKAVSV